MQIKSNVISGLIYFNGYRNKACLVINKPAAMNSQEYLQKYLHNLYYLHVYYKLTSGLGRIMFRPIFIRAFFNFCS